MTLSLTALMPQRCGRMRVLELEYVTQTTACAHVIESNIHILDRVTMADHALEIECAFAPKRQEARDVAMAIARAKQAALQLLLLGEQ